MDKQIKSRWDIRASEMSKKHIAYLIKNNRGIIDYLVNEFGKKYYDISREEITSMVQEGFWRAILAYNPDKGKLSSYAHYYCKSWVNFYLNKTYKKYKENEIIVDNFDEFAKETDHSKLDIESILNKLCKEDREIIVNHYLLNTTTKGTMDSLNINRHEVKRRLKKALESAKRII